MAPGRLITRPIRTTATAITLALTLWVMPAPAYGLSNGECSETTLVLDESGSVNLHEATVRSAVNAFLTPLADTGSAASIVEFGTSAKTVFGYTPITGTTISTIFGPYLNATAAGDVYDAPSQLGGWTNWDDALDEVSQLNVTQGVAPLVLFLTDGDPTAHNLDKSGESGGVKTGGVTSEGVARAVEEANQVKAQGSKIIAIGVGNALTSAASVDRLKQVSGPDVYDGSGTFNLATTDVILVPNFADLPDAMALIAAALCADPDISVEKSVSSPSVIAGTEVTYEITVTNTGNVDLHDVEVSDPLVPDCSATIGDLAVGASETITCTVAVWSPVTNVATATGEDPFGTPVTDTDTATVTLIASGTGTPGFWKNHDDVWPARDGWILIGDWNHNWTCDPDETCLGLTQEEAAAALGTPPKGDMTWNLGRPLVGAWLNVTAGNESSCVAETIDLATAWLLDHPLGSNVKGSDDAWNEASDWATLLDDYNNGLLCAEHRDSGGDGSGGGAQAKGQEAKTKDSATPATSTTTTTSTTQPAASGDTSSDHPGKGKAAGKADKPAKGKKP